MIVMENNMNTLEERIARIEERNRKVEADKAWEGSLMRKMLIILCTYIVVGLFLGAIQVGTPWVNAIVPTIGFFLSTLTMPFFKTMWLKYCWAKKNDTQCPDEVPGE